MANEPPIYSNYPRDKYAYSPCPGPGVQWDAIGDAMRIVGGDLWTWLGATFIAMLLAGVASRLLNLLNNVLVYRTAFPSLEQLGAAGLSGFMYALPVSLIEGMISSVFLIGLVGMGLKKIRFGTVEIGDLFYGFQNITGVAIAYILVSVITSIGLMLLIVPGVFLSGALWAATIATVDLKLGALDAISACYARFSPHAFSFFLFFILLGLVQLLGLLACFVGLLYTTPIVAVALAINYDAAFPAPPPDTQPEVISSEPPRWSC